jgi:hypothetical protein
MCGALLPKYGRRWMGDDAPVPPIMIPPDVALELRVNAEITAGARLPRWGWTLPRSYNGASGDERVAAWQRVRVAELLGWLVRPASCSICDGGQRLHFHAENYFRPMCVRAVCQQCHFTLHRRFRHPARWEELLDGAVASARWAREISLTELSRDEALRRARASILRCT